MLSMRLLLVFLVLSSFPSATADWWDDFADSVSNKLSGAASWVKETAAPAVRDKFNEVKASLQDPDNHKAAKEWISERAEAASEFAQTEVLPELKKIYDAATKEDSSTSSSIRARRK